MMIKPFLQAAFDPELRNKRIFEGEYECEGGSGGRLKIILLCGFVASCEIKKIL